jgi:hypothetical protein
MSPSCEEGGLSFRHIKLAPVLHFGQVALDSWFDCSVVIVTLPFFQVFIAFKLQFFWELGLHVGSWVIRMLCYWARWRQSKFTCFAWGCCRIFFLRYDFVLYWCTYLESHNDVIFDLTEIVGTDAQPSLKRGLREEVLLNPQVLHLMLRRFVPRSQYFMTSVKSANEIRGFIFSLGWKVSSL